jgi:hypothetical protein
MLKYILCIAVLALVTYFSIKEYSEVRSYKSAQCLVKAKNVVQKKISTDNSLTNCFAPEVVMQATTTDQVQTRVLDENDDASCFRTVAQANDKMNAYIINQVYPCWYGSGKVLSQKPTFSIIGIVYAVIAAGFLLFILFFREIFFVSKYRPTASDNNVNKVNSGVFATAFTGNMIYSVVIGTFVVILLLVVNEARTQTTQGTVIVSDVAPYDKSVECQLKTRYTVNNNTYQLSERFYMYGNESCHAVGQSIPVYYDPKNPSQATALTFMQRYLVFGSIVLLGLTGLLLKWLISIAKK